MFWLVAIMMIGGAWWVYADLKHRVKPLTAGIAVTVLVLFAYGVGALIGGMINGAIWIDRLIEFGSVLLFSLAGRSVSTALRRRIGD